MRKVTGAAFVIAWCTVLRMFAADIPRVIAAPALHPAAPLVSYYWRVTPVSNSAQLLTLFCAACNSGNHDGDIPLVALLRDTLGDQDVENDRLTDLWLLSFAPHNLGQQVLAAVPFFYWRLGEGSNKVDPRHFRPLMDLTKPQHPMVTNAVRSVVQLVAFDPLTMPVRASSRAYRSNDTNQERVHLEEAAGYLRQAPVESPEAGLTANELHFVLARLELRKRLLGGLVSRKRAETVGEAEGFEQERIRSRNWELLRELADKTGLLFEPIRVGGTEGEYAILWFPLDGPKPPSGTDLSALWKVLDLKNPWADKRLKSWSGPVVDRWIDENGSLLPEGVTGQRRIRLTALGAYSLSYPKLPLLLIDFRGQTHVKRHEIAQRTVNELTSGVIGLSHFTNWYYYVGADLYDFVVARHGDAMDLQSRLDCYAQFRVALALDSNLDSKLRDDMRRRINSLSVNPLEGSAQREIEVSLDRYNVLERQAGGENGLAKRLDDQRRAELAAFGAGAKGTTLEAILHTISFGIYNQRANADGANLDKLDAERRIQTNLDFLESATAAGTRPEVAYQQSRIAYSVRELSILLTAQPSPKVRLRATTDLDRLNALTQDEALQADCSSALQALRRSSGVNGGTDIVAKPRISQVTPFKASESGQ